MAGPKSAGGVSGDRQGFQSGQHRPQPERDPLAPHRPARAAVRSRSGGRRGAHQPRAAAGPEPAAARREVPELDPAEVLAAIESLGGALTTSATLKTTQTRLQRMQKDLQESDQ